MPIAARNTPITMENTVTDEPSKYVVSVPAISS
jgi:hypothetical protein